MIFSYILIYTCKAEYTKIKRKKKICTCDKQWSMIGHMFQGLSEFELALRKREKKRVLFFPLRLIIRIRMHYHTPQTRKIYISPGGAFNVGAKTSVKCRSGKARQRGFRCRFPSPCTAFSQASLRST